MDNLKLYKQKINNLENRNGIPIISLFNYMERLIYIGNFSQPEITLVLIYLKRIGQYIKITQINIHIMFSLSLMISSKWLDDESYDIRELSELFGITFEELINLEKDYLNYIDWRLYVSKEEFDDKVLELKLVYDNINYNNIFKKLKFIYMIEVELKKMIQS